MYHSMEFRRQLLAAIPVMFVEFIEGIGYGWVSPTLRQIMDNPTGELTFTTDQASWIGSVHEAGRFFGPLLTISLLGRMGRKGIFTLTSLIFVVTFSLIAFTRTVPVIYMSRLAFGVACGMNDVTVSIYISENFKSTFRGVFGSIAIACYFGGFLLELCWVNFFTYDVVAYTNFVVALLILSNVFVSTETASFLITKGRYDKAWKNFLWLRGKETTAAATSCVEELAQFEQLKQQISENRKEKRTISAYLSNPFYRKAITLVLLFSVLMIATGFCSVTSFVSIAFTKGVFTPNEFAILFGTLQFISTVITPTFIERTNRRTILFIALTIVTLVHTATALLFLLQERGVHVPGFSWFVFSTITAYALTYSSGIMTIFYTCRGELMPLNIRAFGGSLVIMIHGLISFLTSKMFLIVGKRFGMYWNFFFYALMSLFGLFFVYFILPETRGKSLEQIQAELMQRSKKEDKA